MIDESGMKLEGNAHFIHKALTSLIHFHTVRGKTGGSENRIQKFINQHIRNTSELYSGGFRFGPRR
jgi:hypothetical protein